jgi:O-antigen/teichoic acid export membrane protein
MLKKTLNRFKGQIVYSFLHQLVMAAYGFGLLFVLIRIMPQNEVGRWLLFVSALSISDMLMHGLLQTVTVKEIASIKNDKIEKTKTLNNAALLAVSLYATIVFLSLILNFTSALFFKPVTVVEDFATWYPLLGILMVIYNLSWWLNTGIENFKRIFIQRVIFSFSSIFVIALYYFFNDQVSFKVVVLSQLAGFAVSATYAFFANGLIFNYKYLNKSKLNAYLSYGKYTFATMLGSSLLRNADTFMIAAFINPKAVAIYVLAQKIIEIFEVVLRSVASNLFLKLFHLKNDMFMFSQKLLKSAAQLTILFLPVALIVGLFSNSVIYAFSGSNDYKLSSEILRIFMIYVILLPADRLIGMALEIADKPQWNMLKTFLLIIVNITGNIIALYYFNSLKAVALVSSLALITGIVSGIYFMHKFDIIRQIQFKKLIAGLNPY